MPPIVHITTVHSPFDNRIFHRECQTLSQAGYQVVLVAPHARDEVVDGVQICALPPRTNRLTRMTLGVWRALRLSLRQRAAVYHFHDPEFILAALLLRLLGKQVVYDVHEDNSTALLEREYLPRFLRSALAHFFALCERVATRSFHIVLAERYYAERFPRGITVLNYARFPDTTQQQLAQRPNLGPARLLYTGNVKEFRGALHHTRILQHNDQAEVFLIGRCANVLAEQLQQMAKDNKRLHLEGVGDYVPHERIIEYYLRERWTAGLAIFPAGRHTLRKELTKIFEYMAYGIPVICSDFPNLRHIVQESDCGLCVDPEDDRAIADAVSYLSENPQEVERLGANGRKAAQERYNWDVEAAKLLDFYSEISE